MSGLASARIVNRRAFIVEAARGGALLGCLSLAGLKARADGGRAPKSKQFEALYRDIVGTASPGEGLVSLTLPDQFDNGHAVPFSIAVASEMSPSSYISDIHMLSTANPVAQVATFHLSPECGAAIVSGRFRLARSQDVYVVAKHNDGKLFVAKQLVKVTISGCS